MKGKKLANTGEILCLSYTTSSGCSYLTLQWAIGETISHLEAVEVFAVIYQQRSSRGSRWHLRRHFHLFFFPFNPTRTSEWWVMFKHFWTSFNGFIGGLVRLDWVLRKLHWQVPCALLMVHCPIEMYSGHSLLSWPVSRTHSRILYTHSHSQSHSRQHTQSNPDTHTQTHTQNLASWISLIQAYQHAWQPRPGATLLRTADGPRWAQVLSPTHPNTNTNTGLS